MGGETGGLGEGEEDGGEREAAVDSSKGSSRVCPRRPLIDGTGGRSSRRRGGPLLQDGQSPFDPLNQISDRDAIWIELTSTPSRCQHDLIVLDTARDQHRAILFTSLETLRD